MTSQPDFSHHMVPHMRDLQPSEMKVIGKMIPEDLGAVSLSGGEQGRAEGIELMRRSAAS